MKANWSLFPSRKLPIILLGGIFCCLIYGFYLKLVSLEHLQKQCFDGISQIKKQSFNHKSPVCPVQHHKPSLKRKYYLSAANAEGDFLKHVRNVFSYLGYERAISVDDDWEVMWSYEYPFPSVVKANTVKGHQLINHIPGSGYLSSKVYLATSKFKYIPTAFSLPRDKDAFLAHAKAHSDKLWVQKSNKHRGISIKAVDQLDLTASDTFIQEFVQDPFLVDKRKFDIGIYTIITSVDPLRIYVLDSEWLLRFCTVDYYPFDVHDFNKYVVGEDYTPTWELPSLKDVYRRLQFSHKNAFHYYLKKYGHDPIALENEIYKAIAAVTYEKKSDMMRFVSRFPYGSRLFFEMVRFDFVIDSALNVYLMEVNMSPNLSSAHYKPNAIMYEQIVLNTLTLVGLNFGSENRNTLDSVLINDRDIQVYGKECLDCTACSSDICQLCLFCLTDSQKSFLKAAYKEHVNRAQCVRVFPQPAHIKENYFDYKNFTKTDKLMHLWFKGMCQKHKSWCF